MKTIRDVDVSNKKVLLRVDFNVPLKSLPSGETEVADDNRIKAVLPTLRYLLEHQAKVIILTHLGRPEGKEVAEYRLDPVALRLQELLGQIVTKCYSIEGEEVEKAVNDMKSGEVVMLTNLRFYPGEEKNDADFAKTLARLGDIYVNDAFAVSHRAHASVEAITHFLPSYAGFLLEKEVDQLGNLLNDPKRPFICILGGAKVEDKIDVIEGLKDKIDVLLVGGVMANTFLAAVKGYDLGGSLIERDSIQKAREIYNNLIDMGREVFLPEDAMVAGQEDGSGENQVVNFNTKFNPEWRIFDIGPETVAKYAKVIEKSKTIFWNGCMGMNEVQPFDKGTIGIAKAMADSSAVTVVTGGDTVGAVIQAQKDADMTYLSTGGGAALEFLAGKELPGVKALD